MPKKGGAEKDVGVAMRLMPDPRANHHWDDSGALMQQYARVLGIDDDAWDVYLLYGPDARWDGPLPPKPTFWMHQLESLSGRADVSALDPATFAQRTTTLLRTL